MFHSLFSTFFLKLLKNVTSIIARRAIQFSSVQFSRSVVSTLCEPMNRSTPGLPVHHQLPEFTQTHLHRVGDAIQPSHPLLSPSPPASNPSQNQGLWECKLVYIACVCVCERARVCVSHSVISNSLWPYRLWTIARLLCPWSSPGKNTGVGCHFLLQGIFRDQNHVSCYGRQNFYSPHSHVFSVYSAS